MEAFNGPSGSKKFNLFVLLDVVASCFVNVIYQPKYATSFPFQNKTPGILFGILKLGFGDVYVRIKRDTPIRLLPRSNWVVWDCLQGFDIHIGDHTDHTLSQECFG